MSIFKNIHECRICGSQDIPIVISLGEQYIASRFPTYGDFSTPKVEINLCKCKKCGLLQLYENVNQKEMYEHEYGYCSGLSNTMRQHLKQYKEEIEGYVELKKDDLILDIGSNDSTMLSYYSNEYRRIGIDPTGKQFQLLYKDIELVPDYFNKHVFQNHFGQNKCKIISSISMFYDLPNPVEFAKDIYECLEEDGIWTCEQSYLLTMVQRNSLDTICHEHLEYYSLKQIKHIADLTGFKIVDVFFNDCNGGSFRIYMAKKNSVKHKENQEKINGILQEEIDAGMENNYFYERFMKSCQNEIDKLGHFIELIQKDDKKMFICGASTKGNTLLQYAKIDETKVSYAVERNVHKIGKMTSTGIPIIGEEKMREIQPEYLLVLPYHFKEEIIKREQDYLNRGGQLVFPFPHFEIYSSKPKMLITGCDGFIGSYMKEQIKDHTLYGVVRTIKNHEKQIHKCNVDMNEKTLLEKTIQLLNPDVIVHLAGISSAQYCFQQPVESLMNNGILTAYLCDIIHRNQLKTRLFNASSSEIFKGHELFTVRDDETFKLHNHPYSIAKTMGHSIVDFYRETYRLPFSNGILFTTESPRKSDQFLLNKIAKHIPIWKSTREVLTLGNLNSYRNIVHPIDVVNAISLIVQQSNGYNYVICHTEANHSVYDLIKRLYEKANIHLVRQEYSVLYDENTKHPVIRLENIQNIENNVINIEGIPERLLKLGWTPKYNADSILDELV